MFRTAENAPAYGVPALLVAELLPGLIDAPWPGRLIDRRDAARMLVLVSALQAMEIALLANSPALTLVRARVHSVFFPVTIAPPLQRIPILEIPHDLTPPRAT